MTATSPPGPCAISRSKNSGSASLAVAPAAMHLVVGRRARLGVVAQAARVVVDDALERGQRGMDLEQLVDLLLVLDDGDARSRRSAMDERHLGGHRVLVERHRHRRRGTAPRPSPSRGAAGCRRRCAKCSPRRKPERRRARTPAPAPRRRLAPASRSARCRDPSRGSPAARHARCVVHEQPRKGVQRPRCPLSSSTSSSLLSARILAQNG